MRGASSGQPLPLATLSQRLAAQGTALRLLPRGTVLHCGCTVVLG